MTPDQVVRLLQDVAAACDVVGLAIAEYMPWEAIVTRNLLRKLPLLANLGCCRERSLSILYANKSCFLSVSKDGFACKNLVIWA